MKSGGPWNLRGLRPETREAARDAARRSGMSVGEWLNKVIRQSDDDYGEPMRAADYDDDEDDWRDDIRHGSRRDDRREPHRRSRYDDPEPPPRRRPEREVESEREAALAREEFGEVHARLDRLTQQLERMAQIDAPRLTGAPIPPRRGYQQAPRPRQGNRPPSHKPLVSVDNAVAEIAERQRQLYGDDAVAPGAPVAASSDPAATAAPPPLPDSQYMSEPPIDISSLEDHLRYLTTQIESLRPSADLERVIKSFRRDLTDIREQITGALPRRAVESLEIEVQALVKRLDRSRESGVDLGVLAGLEGGLREVREALRNLTPAEKLVGFDDAVKALSQKLDLIIAKEDPAALQQLETAIGALRGIVSHVASNDTLTKVADDVRLLAAKVDGVANTAASGQAVSALESRLDTLANALSASSEAGHAVPHELEKLLSGLIEKLEWVQLTHTDHAALGALEDRIAQLIKRLDASDARLGNLEAVERGIADLLVHIDQIRGSAGAGTVGATRKPVDAIARDVAEIKRSERRTQDSLEAVHGAVEHVVDRLAMIESGMHEGATGAEASTDAEPAPEPAPPHAAKLAAVLESMPAGTAAPRHACASDVGDGKCGNSWTARRHTAVADRSKSAARPPARARLRRRSTSDAVGRRTHRGIGSRRRFRQAFRFVRAGRQAEFHRSRAPRGASRRCGAARAPGARRKRHDKCRAIGETVASAQADRRRSRGADCRRLPACRIAHVPGPRTSKQQSGRHRRPRQCNSRRRRKFCRRRIRPRRNRNRGR